ncbi:MAG: hypothetical protein M1825_000721 [Sarcosagium campestre]|nr:MAG: hypothetical protein M1825_000721 [Sarcosagium campestre]
MSNTVHVKNISSQTSEKEVRDFFSFCGKITSLSVTPASGDAGSSQSATVTFEKETAAKTALLLDNTQLGNSHVVVSAAQGLDDLAPGKTAASGDESKDSHEVDQEDKPRSRIIAEYLAHGYTIGDTAIQRAIELDKKHGISGRFTSALANFDNKVKATDKARSVDAKVGVTEKAQAGWRSLNSFFEKAAGTPTGQKVVTFYEQGDKQIRDIHTEARRLADLKKQESGVTPVAGTDKTTCKCGGNTEQCPCAPGHCACNSCPKATMGIHPVPGTGKTACSCAGDTGVCPCESGKCACEGCDKATDTASSVAPTATGATAEVAADSKVAPLGEKIAPTDAGASGAPPAGGA